MIPEEYWDVEIPRWSKAAAARFMMALVEVEGIITCTFPHRYGPHGKIASVDFRIRLPIKMRTAFESLLGQGVRPCRNVCVKSCEEVSGQ